MSAIGIVKAKLKAALEVPIAPPLTAVIIAEDLTEPQNNSVIDERIAIGEAIATGVAIETTHVQIFNPLRSGALLVVKDCWVDIEGASTLALRTFDTAIATNALTKAFRDTRITGSPVAELRQASLAAPVGATVGLYEALAAETYYIELDFILAQDTGILIAAGTVDLNLRVTYRWRELSLPNA